MTRTAACLASIAVAWATLCESGPAAVPPGGPVIETDDVARFYRLYDAAGGHPAADQLQHDYLDAGSEGLHQLAQRRNVTGERIAQNIADHPEVYQSARACMALLPRVRRRAEAALIRLGALYPAARFPPVTIAVGRGKPVGMTDPGGVRIGLEALCATTFMNPNPEDRFVHVIAHEYVHIQQALAQSEEGHPTVLEASLVEGGAEFVAELISGDVANQAPRAEARGREREVETAFVGDEDKTDLSDWLYNGTSEKPGDLGYWVGYRIVKTYYRNAPDKRRALAEIFEMTDPKAFLARSGWRPGIAVR